MLEKPKTGIEDAVDICGSQSELARRLGVTPQAVQQMVERGYAPVDRLVEIEVLTGVPRERLCDPKIAELFSSKLPDGDDA